MDNRGNLLKAYGSKNYHHPIEVISDEWKKEDPPTMKKLPIEADIPEHPVQMAMETDASKGQKAIANLTLIAFYYLPQEGEYVCRQRRDDEKQTVQFRIKDVTFFQMQQAGPAPADSVEYIIRRDHGSGQLHPQVIKPEE